MKAGALLVVASLLLAGCSGDSEEPAADPPSSSASSPVATPTPAEPAPRPANKACYAMAYDEALAPTSDAEATACTDDHTAMTFAVGDLDTIVGGHLLAVDSQRVQRQVARECPARLPGFIGGTLENRRLSMLRTVWFTPTVEESDAGANWYRCDVIAVASDSSLVPLTGRIFKVLGTQEGRDRYGMCATDAPGADDFERVVCSAAHSWKAQRTVLLRPGKYPGIARVRAAGDAPCEAAGRSVADDPLSFRWGYEWPTLEKWKNGQTYGICWVPD